MAYVGVVQANKVCFMCSQLNFDWDQPWALEGFFSRGVSRGISQIFSRGRAKNGEICFLHHEIEKTTFFAHNFKIQGGLGPPSHPSDAHGIN